MSESRVINQRLRDFIVQILDKNQEKIVGTAFAVDYHQAKFVTCAHVVKGVLGDDLAGEIYIRFPETKDKQILPAKVLAYFPNYDDDVALLQLIETAKMPILPDKVAIIGKAEGSEGNPFQSFGYRPLGMFEGGYIEGKILDFVEPPINKMCQMDMIQLKTNQVRGGMSGAPILDKERNLIVGVVAQRYKPNQEVDFNPEEDTAFGVDSCVLSLEPLKLNLHPEYALTRKPSAQPTQTAPLPAPLRDDVSRAPNVLTGWVGRADLLAQLDRVYADTQTRVMGLVGFGGEGKTSLARKWIQTVLDDPARKPAGVFWWAFYDDRSVDAFLEALLTYMAGEAVAKTVRGASARAQIIGAMMQEQRYVVVLDGFEVMQQQDGDEHGRITSDALRELLEFCASQKSQSCCVITTRTNLIDMQPFTTYQHIDITQMSEADGLALMRQIGVTGDEKHIKQVVKAWDGHALTLGLLGTYLVSKFDGDIIHIRDVPPPHADEPLYERVQRLLRQYDKHLSPAERAFMLMFCAFRLPVRESAFTAIFRTTTSATALNEPLTALDDTAFDQLIARLVARRLITPSEADGAKTYTTHPLIRAHYEQALTGYDGATAHHKAIADWYKTTVPEDEQDNSPMAQLMRRLGLGSSSSNSKILTLDDLKPYIEMVHHLCRAGAYDEAHEIRRERIQQGSRNLTVHILGAYETELNIMLEFFPNGDTSQDPAVTKPDYQRFILNAIGFCHQNLGRSREAVPFIERHNQICIRMKDYRNASGGYQNLTDIALALGNLADASGYVEQALTWAGEMDAGENRQNMEITSLAYQAWIAHLRGLTVGDDGATSLFKRAEGLEQEYDPNKQYLYSNRGIFHADCLHRTGDSATARAITDANLEIVKRNNVIKDIVLCHRVLGDLDADAGQFDSAQTHYNEAIEIARKIDRVDVRIEALLGRGRFYAKQLKKADSAFNDLHEAFSTAQKGEYKPYEADIRIALAWAHLANGDVVSAKNEAGIARQMSIDMGYHWGVVDADAVLGEVRPHP